jgi:hypothetical protein
MTKIEGSGSISQRHGSSHLALLLLLLRETRETSVPDPDPHVFGPPGSGSTSKRYGSRSGSCSGSGSGSFYHHAKIVIKTLIPTILWLFLTFYL